MNFHLHPHWQSTDDGSPVPVRVTSEKQTAPTRKTISRRPAAIVGMLVTTIIGTILYSSSSSLEGDITNSEEMTGGEPPQTFMDILAEHVERTPSDFPSALPQDVPLARVPLSPSIPVNPQTTDLRPSVGGSIPRNGESISPDVRERMHRGAPQPLRTPNTGAETLLATIIIASGAFFLMTRGSRIGIVSVR